MILYQEDKVTVQIKKTYMGINHDMLSDEIRGLAKKQGIKVGEIKVQTYPLPSGATQTRVTVTFKTQSERPEDEKECGSAHILSLPGGETKLVLDLSENLLPKEKISSLEEDLDFILGSYEIKW